MTRYIALLRGINVGGKNKIAMADFRALLTGLGYTDAITLLNSGNAVFTGPKRDALAMAGQIDAAITEQLGLSVSTVIRTAAQMRTVVEADPFAGVATDPARYVVLFLSGAPQAAAVAAIDPGEYAPEEFRLVNHEFYVWCPAGLREAKLTIALSHKRFGVIATARNWNTVTKLLALAEA